MFCGQKNHKKINNNFVQRTFSQRSPKGKQNEIVVFHDCPFQGHAGAWGEENTKDEKEKEQEEKTQTRTFKRDTKKIYIRTR